MSQPSLQLDLLTSSKGVKVIPPLTPHLAKKARLTKLKQVSRETLNGRDNIYGQCRCGQLFAIPGLDRSYGHHGGWTHSS